MAYFAKRWAHISYWASHIIVTCVEGINTTWAVIASGTWSKGHVVSNTVSWVNLCASFTNLAWWAINALVFRCGSSQIVPLSKGAVVLKSINTPSVVTALLGLSLRSTFADVAYVTSDGLVLITVVSQSWRVADESVFTWLAPVRIFVAGGVTIISFWAGSEAVNTGSFKAVISFWARSCGRGRVSRGVPFTV